MFLTNVYPLSFTIFLAIIVRGKSKHYDSYDMKEDRPMLDSVQIMTLLREADHPVKTVASTLSATIQPPLFPAKLRLKNVDVEDNITPGKLLTKYNI